VSEKNPLIADPLKRSDCSPVSDGAAALVLTTADRAARVREAVRVRALVQVNDWLSLRDRALADFDGPRRAFGAAFEAAGVGLDDLGFVEVHDCFTTAELLAYEAMGLCARGEGRRAIEDGWVMPDGRLPVNVSGGLKAKGHPVGASGVSMHVMAARQLLGRPNGVALRAPTLGAVFNMGGAAVANYVSVLERQR
jgi:acetyl-CoA C-acetyltransferase